MRRTRPGHVGRRKWSLVNISPAKGAATRQRIIVAGAAAEIRDRGVALTTLDDIRARTGTSRASCSTTFPVGKERLLAGGGRQHEAERVLSDQQPHLRVRAKRRGRRGSAGAMPWWTVIGAGARARPLSMLMSEIGRSHPGAQAVTTTLMPAHGAARSPPESSAMQAQGKIPARMAPSGERTAGACWPASRAVSRILLATGDMSYLEPIGPRDWLLRAS